MEKFEIRRGEEVYPPNEPLGSAGRPIWLRLNNLDWADCNTRVPSFAQVLYILQVKLNWRQIWPGNQFLGLCVFNKIDSHQTRPLIRNCMPPKNTGNTRANGTYIKQKFQSVNFSNSFFPFFSEMWSKLDKSLREEVDLNEFKSKLKPSFKPKRHKHFNCGSKYGITLLCRLRLGRSFLKAHGFAINLINVCGAELKAHLIIMR